MAKVKHIPNSAVDPFPTPTRHNRLLLLLMAMMVLPLCLSLIPYPPQRSPSRRRLPPIRPLLWFHERKPPLSLHLLLSLMVF